MAKVDLSSAEWCDLIFNGKNKAYGAYKMRENSPKRHNIAVVLVIVIALVGFSVPTLIKMATPKQKEVMTEVTTLSQLEEPEVKQEEMKRVEPVAPPPPALKSSIKFTAPVIKKDEEVRDEDEIKSQEELTQTKVAISIADVKGNDEENGKDIADLKQVVTQAPVEEEKVFDMVEQMPQFPGGQTELLKYIANHLKQNIRQLEGAVKKLNAYYMLEGIAPCIGVTTTAIKDTLNDTQPIPVTIEKIINEVARTYNVIPSDIRGKKRSANVSAARQMSMYIIREITGMSMEAIGSEFQRDHSTVVYSINTMEKNIGKDRHLKETVDDIMKNIRA